MVRKTTLTLFTLLCIAVTYAQTANFTASTTSGCSPLVVNFQDQSTGNPTSWLWDFGNGATATLQNPSTTYFTPGTYTVTLTVTGANGSNTLSRTQYITVYGKPAVNFIVNDSTACFPHRAQFTDLSTASTGTSNSAWFWDFGDGSQSSEQNPLHTFNTPGNYTINLKVTNDKGCFSVFSKQSYIQIASGVTSGFSNPLPTVCQPPYNISFTNSSTGPGTLSWFWDFGDGNTSTNPNPTHTYTAPGNYTVTLATTSSDGCSDTLRKAGALNILDINTSITMPDSICINAPVSFMNNSTPAPISTVWNFGDGTTSTELNPLKSFSAVGSFTVTLQNTYDYCTESVSRLIQVLPRPLANFTSDVTSKCQPNLTVNFQDQSTNAVSWLWDFGDGTTSTQQHPSHTYTGYGNFTVRLTVTNLYGCTDTLRRPGYINIARPVISFSNLPQEGCIPYSVSPVATITTLDAVTSYSWDFGDGTTSTSQNPSHTYAVEGTYTVSLTITTSTGCTETYSLAGAVKVGRIPTININATPNPVCAREPVQFTDLTNFADKWLWDFGDGGTSIEENPLHRYSDTGLFTIKLEVTNNGCKTSLTFPDYVRVRPPIARFEYIPDCDNRFLFRFQNRSIYDPALGVSWSWDFGDGSAKSTDENPTHIFPALGSYNVTLAMTNGGCTDTTRFAVRVIDEKPDFAANVTTACKVAAITFNVQNSSPNIVNYAWDFGNGNVVNTSSTSVGNTYGTTGFYPVRMVSTDIYGCLYTVSKPDYIRINGPTAAFNTNDVDGCLKSNTITFDDQSTTDGVNNIISWQWNFGDGIIQTFPAAPFQHSYTQAGLFTVKLKVTDASGCSDSVTRTDYITIADPKAAFSSADTLTCPGSSVQFTNQSNAVNYTSLWNFGNTLTSTLTNPSTVYTIGGLYGVELIITDQYGCKDTLFKPDYITVDNPIASYSVNDSVSSCTPFEVLFTNTSQYFISSLWELGGGVSTLKDPIQYYNTPNLYNIRLIVTSPGNCKDTTYGTIQVFDTVGSRVTYTPLDGCKPLSVDLTTFSPGPMTYTWDFGDGTLITNTDVNMNHVYNFFGNFVPKVIMTDPTGCIIPVTGLDTIRIKGAIVKFGLDKRFFCDSGLVRFIDSTTFNDPLMVYNWDFGDGTTSNLQNPTHFYNSPGFYTPTLNVQTQNACVDTFRLSNAIKIVQSPLISIGGDSVICVNDFMQHFGVFERSDTSAVQWSWQIPNGQLSNLQNPVRQQYNAAGNFVVRTVATNSSGCKDTATKNIRINPLPEINAPSAITMQVGFPITIPATYTSNVVSWAWAPAATLNCADCPEPIANPKFDTKYKVSVIDSNGCTNSADIQVIVICKNSNVFVPNTFSPNGDGNNDIFYVRGKGLDRVKSLRIFNRWGELVFEQQNLPVNNAMYGWNGTYKGNKPIPDVYVYQVEVYCDNSQIIRFDGNVALIQ